MRKTVAMFLILLMVVGLLVSCGSNEEHEEEPVVDTPVESTPDADEPNTKDATPGTELATFVDQYTTAKSEAWDAMAAKLEDEDNMAFMMGSMGFAFSDLVIVEIVMFDVLSEELGDVFGGKLMFSDIEAWKKVNGDIVEFGYDHVYEEDSNTAEKGDRHFAQGKLDKKSGTVIYETTIERAGKIINKNVVEITRNSDTSYSSQVVTLDGESMNVSAYLTWFEDADIVSILATQENASIDFAYNSIYGKKNVKPEEMATGMDIQMITSLTDGVAIFESNEYE
ncbi:MAG: hypothetical protein NUK65_10960 [Firmicutes bacterium]|nr:hypothetical protein [Bacillota bacterium]